MIYHGHASYVHIVTWSPNGKYIASGGYDQTVQVWNVATGSRLISYYVQYEAVITAAWSPDSQLIASAGLDTTVAVWQAV